MSSFSSFVRKPGKVAAPKKIPQRRQPAKSAAPVAEQTVVVPDSTTDISPTETNSSGLRTSSDGTNGVGSAVQIGVQQNERPRGDVLGAEQNIQNQESHSIVHPPSIHTSAQQIPSLQSTPQVLNGATTTTTLAANEGLSSTNGHLVSEQESHTSVSEQHESDVRPTNQSARRTRGQKVKQTVEKNSTVHDQSFTPAPTSVAHDDNSTSMSQVQTVPYSPASSHADVFQQIASRIQSGIQTFRASQTPSRTGSVAPVQDNPDAARGDPIDTESHDRPRKRRKRNDNRSQTIQEQVAEVVAHATGSEDLTPRKRRGTPEGAEGHEIEVETVKLSELCDDHKWGRKSNREKEMAANWPEILRRRKEENEERMRKAEERRSRKRKDQPMEGDTGLIVPEQAIVNGEIVAAGRVVDNRAQIVLEANDESRPVLEARDIFNRVTQDTIAPRKKLPAGQYWDEANTDLFYQGLSMFGTDFNMIANMIPTKNRRQVKLKYNLEERNNWSKVKAALNKTENVSLDQYADMTGLTFGSVEDLYKELEEDEKRIRAEDEARRKEEGIIPQPGDGNTADSGVEADVAMPSIEDQEGEPTLQQTTGEAQSDRARSTATTRLGSATTGGRQTAQPPGATKKKVTRKTNPNTKRGRQAANKRNNFEGIEESLGPADQVSVPMN